ncbi:MAG: RibD family protein [Planctomycetes bacterium]|nr:RibD family protein [Planctomycetota bacterium]
MDRPYIICHMVTSIDGKTTGKFFEKSWPANDEYERIHREYDADAWLCGRVTMEENFTDGLAPDLSKKPAEPLGRDDYVAVPDARRFAVAIDSHGRLGWPKNFIDDDHVVEVLAENVSDEYLAYLRDRKISYIFGGRETLDFSVVAAKLKKLFSIEKILLEGGGVINGSFLGQGLIDEISWLVIPGVDGGSDAHTTFEAFGDDSVPDAVGFTLKDVKKVGGGGVWITYVK